jgi:adenosine deaminase
LRDLGRGKRAYLESVLQGLEAAKRKYNTENNLLLGLKRDSSDADMTQTLAIAKEYQKYGVSGIDISGKASKGDLAKLAKFIDCSKNTLPITMHIGEIKNGLDLNDLKIINPSRVSHAVYISQEIKDFLKRAKIPIEICVSSNNHTRMISQISRHPFMDYYPQGFDICICSDDPLIFQTDTSKEYGIFKEYLNLSEEDLRLFTKNAIKYSFASKELKEELLGDLGKNS